MNGDDNLETTVVADQKTGEGSTTFRLVTAAFGMLFLSAAVTIVVVTEFSVGPVLAAAVIGLLGADAIVGSYRNTRSLLSRIGPLP
jgi:hypothetical protein